MTHAAPPTPPSPSKSKADLEQVRALLGSLLAEGRNDEAIEVALSMLGQLQAHNADLAWQVLKLRREQYGRRSGRVDPAQLSLLLELAGPVAVDEESDRTETAAEDAALTAEREALEAGEPAAERGRARRRRPSRALPREIIRHELPEADRLCGGCGTAMPEIGVDVSELVELVPAHFLVEEHHRVKYACGRCKDAVRTAPGPVKLIEKRLPGPGLLAHVAMSKYQDALPLNRLVEIYCRSGFKTSVSTLCGWVAAVATEVKPVVDRILEKALASFLVQTDGSGLKVLDRDDPEGIRRGTMWCLVGDRRYAVFLYARDGTGEEGPWRYLEGREGYLQADAANIFDRLYNGDRARAVEVGCWAHARRRLHDLVESDARAAYPLQLIAQLYRIEDLADRRGFTPDQRLDLRRGRSRAIADRYHRWIRRTLEAEPPSSNLAKACAYSLNHWTALTRFLEEARLSLDNNLRELQIRSLAVGRKNFLFCWTELGAKHVGIIQSLLSTCRVQGVDPYTYLVDVLQRIETHPAKDVALLTPRLWKEHFGQNPLRSDIDRNP